MAVIKVPDMQCEHCVQRIREALIPTGIRFEISLEDKTVTVFGCGDTVFTVMDEIEDLGFTAIKA